MKFKPKKQMVKMKASKSPKKSAPKGKALANFRDKFSKSSHSQKADQIEDLLGNDSF